MLKKKHIIRFCSQIGLQNQLGYFIREDDLHPEDITQLKALGYKLYGMRQAENKPFTIENRLHFRGRIGIAVMKAPIIFRKRDGISENSAMNYFVMNNQHSWFESKVVKRDFAAAVNRPDNTVKDR